MLKFLSNTICSKIKTYFKIVFQMSYKTTPIFKEKILNKDLNSNKLSFKHKYKRPEQIRDIPLKYSCYRGMVLSTKHHLRKNEKIAFSYESTLERDFYLLLDHDFNCFDFQPQPVAINWIDDNGNEHTAYPDCWAIFYPRKQYLFQIKYIKDIIKLENDPLWHQELKAIKKYCKKHGWEFMIIHEGYVRNTRLTNVNLFRDVTLHPPNHKTIEKVRKSIPFIYQRQKEFTYRNLINMIRNKTKINISLVEKVIHYLIFHQLLYFNWNYSFTIKTSLKLNYGLESLNIPIYLVDSNLPTKNVVDYPPVPIQTDITLLDEKYKDIARRIEIIKPLIFDTNRTKKAVEDQAKKYNINPTTIYRWIKKYTNSGGDWRSLLPNKRKRKNSNFSSQVENIINQELCDFNRSRTKISQSAIYENIKAKCIIEGYQPPSYVTIHRRIARLPAKQRYGKQGGFIRNEIQQSVRGKLPVGIKPLDIIQMDHTLLDIWLVDQQYLKPLGRPYLTLAVDTYSRMIYGYELSFSNPNSTSVTKALKMGFLPKDEILKKFNINADYPIYGKPTRIQVDNAKEFCSKHLNDFCFIYNIDLEFRPVRRADKGAFVERLLGTINRRIRDEQLPGYAPPLKERQKDYDPSKFASLTLPQFEKWLLSYITKYYHKKTHSTLKKSPLKKYKDCFSGKDDGIRFHPSIPVDKTKLTFDTLPFCERTLNKYGIQWNNNTYFASILSRIRENEFRKTDSKSLKIKFRYDQNDIRLVWVFYQGDDRFERGYYTLPLTRGDLLLFIKKNPELPISLGEYKKVREYLSQEGKVINIDNTEKSLTKRKEEIIRFAKINKKARKKNELFKNLEIVSQKRELIFNVDSDESNEDWLTDEWEEVNTIMIEEEEDPLDLIDLDDDV